MSKKTLLLVLLIVVHFAGHGQYIPIKIDSTIAVEKASTFLGQLQEVYRNGNYEVHKQYSDSLYHWAKQNKLTRYEILGMVNQAIYFNIIGSHDTAVSLYRNALALSDSIPEDHRTKIIVMVNLGNVYTNIGFYEKAIEVMENVLVLLDTIEDNPKIRSSAYNGLANNYNNLGKEEKVLEFHIKSKKLGEQIEDESIVATALGNITDTYMAQKQYGKAQEAVKQALSLSITKKPTKQRGWLLINLGLTEWNLGNLKKAKSCFLEAKNIAEEKSLIKIEVACYKNLAEIYKTEKDDFKAFEAKEKYLSLKNMLLNNKQNATKIDLEKDLSEKEEIIKSKETDISNLESNKNNLLFWSALAVICFVGVSILFYVYSKRSKKEKLVLQKQFIELKNYTDNKNTADNTEEKSNLNPKLLAYKYSSLKEADLIMHKDRLLKYMEVEKPYLNNELSQTNLANQLEISSHHLSEVLSSGFDQNFYNFINSYRVMEAQRLVEKSDAKILAIAFDSGFKSKTSFNRVFKKHTGLTPSEFKNNLTK